MGLISIEDCKLERNGRDTVLKKRSVAKLIKTNENLNLCYIWRLPRPPPPKQTNKKHALHISGCFIQKGLDYFFVSNTLQNFVKKQNQQQQFFFSFE